jgi:opacity protein-like surface antigen
LRPDGAQRGLPKQDGSVEHPRESVGANCNPPQYRFPLKVARNRYDFTLSENFTLSAGIGVGVTSYNAEIKRPNFRDTARQSAATFALDLGATYHLSESWKFDLAYKFLANGDMKLAEGFDKVSSNAHSFAITAGYKF